MGESAGRSSFVSPQFSLLPAHTLGQERILITRKVPHALLTSITPPLQQSVAMLTLDEIARLFAPNGRIQAMLSIHQQTTLPPSDGTLAWLLSRQRAIILLASFILLSDILFIALHTEAQLRGSQNSLLFIDFDRGYAEFFQYLKMTYALLLIALVSIETRSWILSVWMIPFAYLLSDDAMQIHERGGEYLAQLLSLQPGLGVRAVDFGEIAVSGIAGLIILPLLGMAYWKANAGERWIFHRLIGLIVLLALFGIVIDLAHVAAHSLLGGFDWIAVIEDGGEMVAATLIVTFLLRLNLSGGERGFRMRPLSSRTGVLAENSTTTP